MVNLRFNLRILQQRDILVKSINTSERPHDHMTTRLQVPLIVGALLPSAGGRFGSVNSLWFVDRNQLKSDCMK